MHGNPLPYADPNTGDLTILNPDSCQAFTRGGDDTELIENRYKGLFNESEVSMQIFSVVSQVKYRVTH